MSVPEPPAGDAEASHLSPRDEIARLLREDTSRLGDIYRWLGDGLDEEAIRIAVGAKNANFVYSYKQIISAALDGESTARGRSSRQQVVGALNSLLKKARNASLSADAVQALIDHRTAIEAAGLVEDEVVAAQAEEDEREQAKKTLGDLDGVAGIYAFSCGWYLEHPVDPDRDTTFIKVGKAVNVAERIKTHTGGARTHMPEPLALIRVYGHDDFPATLDKVERQFHDLLAAAGHENPRWANARREVGREWFVTNREFLDKVAEVVGLRIEFEGWSEFEE